ncbi:MAG TPA: metal-sensitive transcriptional regulator [Candidatus Dormibacteraeota bacterium]|jgi:DNA-binding FrmR family transcriptional regulator
MAVIQSTEQIARISASLRRIEGQCRGLQKMLDDGRECAEVLQQLSAARSALESASFDVAACAVEAELAGVGLSELQRHRLRDALAQLGKLR